MRVYSTHDLLIIKNYKCLSKACQSNARFKEDTITTMDVLNLLERFKFRCVYCSKSLSSKTWQLDHFYSKAMGGKNKIHNLAPACKWCNQMKGALDGHAFILRCEIIFKNNILNSFLDGRR
jgi:5-methylcytosine-specific restriction endonuclease McrA